MAALFKERLQEINPHCFFPACGRSPCHRKRYAEGTAIANK